MIPGIHFKLIVQPVNKVLLVELSQEQNTGKQKVEKPTELKTYIYHSLQRENEREKRGRLLCIQLWVNNSLIVLIDSLAQPVNIHEIEIHVYLLQILEYLFTCSQRKLKFGFVFPYH